MIMRLVTCIFLVCSPVFGQLAWEKNPLEFHPTISDTNVVVNFSFENKGKYSVEIKDIKTSCGCTTAKLDKKKYTPGEKGQINAIFTIGQRMGEQHKSLLVTTDDPKEASTTLKFTVHIPELLRMKPNFVFWKVDEEKKPKSIDIEILQDEPADLLAQGSNPKLLIDLKTVKKGKKYELVVTPTDTSQDVWSNIILTLKLSEKKEKTFQAYARVGKNPAMANQRLDRSFPGRPPPGSNPAVRPGPTRTVSPPYRLPE